MALVSFFLPISPIQFPSRRHPLTIIPWILYSDIGWICPRGEGAWGEFQLNQYWMVHGSRVSTHYIHVLPTLLFSAAFTTSANIEKFRSKVVSLLASSFHFVCIHI